MAKKDVMTTTQKMVAIKPESRSAGMEKPPRYQENPRCSEFSSFSGFEKIGVMMGNGIEYDGKLTTMKW